MVMEMKPTLDYLDEIVRQTNKRIAQLNKEKTKRGNKPIQ